MPITAIRAGATPPSGVLARITASSAACSTATHTDVSALQTSVTSSMPSRSADATRASSRRRSVRAAAIARTGSECRPADATSARASAVGLDLEQLRPARAVRVLLDDLRRPHQQVRHIRRRPQHPHQPLGHRAFVAQRGQVPTMVGQLVTDPPVRQQPRIGIGRVRQPVQQRRQQHLLHPTTPAGVAGQRRKMRQRALRPLVSQRGELTFGGLRRQHRRAGQPLPAAADRRAWRAAATRACSGA